MGTLLPTQFGPGGGVGVARAPAKSSAAAREQPGAPDTMVFLPSFEVQRLCKVWRSPFASAQTVQTPIRAQRVATMSPALISLICAVGNAVGFAGHLFMPPCWLRSPQKTRVFGRWTFLTNQSNAILVCYHALRFAAPAHALARRAYPLAFALGVGLTLLYYGLDHFVAAKRAEDRLWVARGFVWIPVACHVEHGLALPLALLDARYGGHAGESTGGDVVVLVGGFAAFYLLGTLLNKKLTGLWLYPISDELEKALGPAGFWVLSIPVTVTYVTLGFVGRHVAG